MNKNEAYRCTCPEEDYVMDDACPRHGINGTFSLALRAYTNKEKIRKKQNNG